ncbi:MAG: Methylase/methyltransferase, partial [Candidatus Gottesmanbacteria bacterium GW2011_GWA2_47_9]
YLLEQVGAASRAGVESEVDHVTASGIKVYSDIDDVGKKHFDLVTAIHVLEHVADPLAFLKRMVACTNPNGHLIIEVPTWKSPGGPLRLPHLFHFEPDVLRLMCREVGLNVEHTEFTPHLMLICRA